MCCCFLKRKQTRLRHIESSSYDQIRPSYDQIRSSYDISSSPYDSASCPASYRRTSVTKDGWDTIFRPLCFYLKLGNFSGFHFTCFLEVSFFFSQNLVKSQARLLSRSGESFWNFSSEVFLQGRLSTTPIELKKERLVMKNHFLSVTLMRLKTMFIGTFWTHLCFPWFIN